MDIDDAVVTLRDSAQYGVAMFPDTGENKRKGARGDDDEMGVADQIVMERARARRREIAEEEKVEEEMLEEERAAQRAKARESRREKALERAQQIKARTGSEVGGDDTSEVSEASETRRTRRRTRQRAVTADNSESDAMSVDSLASKRAPHKTKKGVRSVEAKVVRATPQPECSDSDSVELVDDMKRKTSLVRRSKTRERSTEPATHVTTAATTIRERTKPFSTFASLGSDGEGESTPRPTRQRTTDTNGAESAVDCFHARTLPLQMARNRPGAR